MGIQIAVLGASGKMGRGIALLCLQEMVFNEKATPLKLIDVNPESFHDLKLYLKQQLTRFAEKNINKLRSFFSRDKSLVSNAEMIDKMVEHGMLLIDCSTAIEHAQGSKIIFEAIFEEIPLKVEALSKLHKIAPDAHVFTNTSSIPIALLAEKSGLKEKLIGMHFYNPPPVQKLLEIIPSKYSPQSLVDEAFQIGKQFNKTIVVSNDVPGFIGNGHFVREIAFAFKLVQDLQPEHSEEVAVQIVDAVTKNFLLRPMGIFQLLDYVGLPIAKNIFSIIGVPLPELLRQWIESKLTGGQTVEGYPKDGIYAYIKGVPDKIYSLKQKQYIPLADMSFLGKPPLGMNWKKAQNEPKKIMEYFDILFKESSLGAQLARKFLEHSADIEEQLVKSEVALSLEDVGCVIKNGFYHPYAPHEIMMEKV